MLRSQDNHSSGTISKRPYRAPGANKELPYRKVKSIVPVQRRQSIHQPAFGLYVYVNEA